MHAPRSTPEDGAAETARREREKRWLEESREAIADANAFLTAHGLWSDGLRSV